MIRDLRQRIETVDRRKHLAAFLGQQGLGGTTYGLAVVHDENLQSVETSSCVIRHRISPCSPGMRQALIRVPFFPVAPASTGRYARENGLVPY